MLTGRKRKKNVQKKIRKIKYSRGVQAVLWGVCKITEKRKLGLRGEWTEPGWFVGFWVGSWTCYIRAVGKRSLISLLSFSLYLGFRVC